MPDNRGAMTLTVAPGGVAAGPTNAVGGLSGRWRDLVDIFNRTAGVSVIAAFALGVSGILLFMPQGRDLVRGVGEDGLGRVAIAFALGILFFAIQAWSWSRIVIASNYGTDRTRWRPRWLLEWGPRVLAFLPFAAAGLALLISFKWNAPVGLLLLAIGVIFLLLVIAREPLTKRLVGNTETAPWIPGTWVIAGLAMAFGAMVVAILWPAGIGVALGGPAIVFFGLGFIIPLITIACQLGTSLRIPVTGALLLWAVLLGMFFDNHRVGRRALIAETGGSTDRPTLESAFRLWGKGQPVGPNGKRTMVLIAVQGGASRAGYWTAVALAQLQTAAAKLTGMDGKPVDFSAHVFAISSVSGGSVGSVGYAAMLKTAPPNVRTPTTVTGRRDPHQRSSAVSPAATRSAPRSRVRSIPTCSTVFCPCRCFPIARRRSSAPGKRRGTPLTTAPAWRPGQPEPFARRSSRLPRRTANRGGRFSSCRAQARAAGGAC